MARLALLFLLASCAPATEPSFAPPAEPVGHANPAPAQESDLPATLPATTNEPSPPPPSPDSRPRLPVNCQAPLAATEEISRLLVAAAAHGTSSSACVDGPGERYTVDEILACPAASTGRNRVFDVDYRVTLQREGDTRGCHPHCDWLKPESARHRAQVTFTPVAKGGHQLDAPSHVPGLEHATPLDQEHDGDCYGKSLPFVPRTIELR